MWVRESFPTQSSAPGPWEGHRAPILAASPGIFQGKILPLALRVSLLAALEPSREFWHIQRQQELPWAPGSGSSPGRAWLVGNISMEP